MSMEPRTREELLAAAQHEYRAFRQALDGLSEAQLTEAWLGTWSIKEIVAHISGWHREMGSALERLARGERPIPEGVSYDDVDAWNATFAAAARGTPVAEVLAELDRSHTAFMALVARVPVDRLAPGRTAWRIADGSSAHHYREHGDQIRAWRAARGVQNMPAGADPTVPLCPPEAQGR